MIWNWLARNVIALPSVPRFGLLGHMNTGWSGTNSDPNNVPETPGMDIMALGGPIGGCGGPGAGAIPLGPGGPGAE